MSYLTRRKILIGIATFTCASIVGTTMPIQAKGFKLPKGLKAPVNSWSLRPRLSGSRCSQTDPIAKQRCEEQRSTSAPVAGGIVGAICLASWLRYCLKSRQQRRLERIDAELAELESQLKGSANPVPQIDPIEAELNRRSAERWLSENQKWECFRSGPVGPYTKEELRSIQKITAKTNVRRVGETDWTRAGQIPELAEFLTVKS